MPSETSRRGPILSILGVSCLLLMDYYLLFKIYLLFSVWLMIFRNLGSSDLYDFLSVEFIYLCLLFFSGFVNSMPEEHV